MNQLFESCCYHEQTKNGTDNYESCKTVAELKEDIRNTVVSGAL